MDMILTLKFVIFLLVIMLLLNIVFAIIIIFLERKNPTATWAWIMVLILLPDIGFILYLLFNQDLSKKKIFRLKAEEDQLYNDYKEKQLEHLTNAPDYFNIKSIAYYQEIVHLNLLSNNAILTQDNEIDIFVDGKAKFEALLKSIEAARHHIHIQYYIIRKDDLSHRVLHALTKKAKEGVEVRLLFDEVGSRSISRKLLKALKAAGGKAAAFFPSKIPHINFRINYRNHRKIVVIDGKYGYIGGFNIGDEYLGLNKKVGYWRDTHIKINGSAVYELQARFILDWRHASGEAMEDLNPYYSEIGQAGSAGIQIVSSGPDSKEEQIKYGYMKMIHLAQESIYIQTPYFIPDESILESLKIAALSGIDVRIMIPNKPDHMFVYWATYAYIGELLKYGIRPYIYENGFLHAKTLVIDGQAASVGTANIDIRSFKLNFEVNAFIYDRETAGKLKQAFEEDIEVCTLLTEDLYAQRSMIIRFKEAISRLLSPIL